AVPRPHHRRPLEKQTPIRPPFKTTTIAPTQTPLAPFRSAKNNSLHHPALAIFHKFHRRRHYRAELYALSGAA
ncbi:MAG: hypothetical protein M1830_007244, partial [Pleopsidium flavum]